MINPEPLSGESRGLRGNGIIALLAMIYFLHSVDRQIIAVVLEPIKHEFMISDKMLGLVGGLGYGIAFAIACIPIGWIIDRSNRVRLLALLLAIWSSLTALCGFASSFWTLLAARMGVGAAEAGGSPTIMSLISDYFAPARRASAIGACYMSTAFGVGASFLIGSIVATHFGWRAAFFVAGVPGILLSLLVVSALREPQRGATEEDAAARAAASDTPGALETLRHIGTNRPLICIAAAITLATLVWTGLWVWCSSLLIRFHGFTLQQAGTAVAAAAIFQATGSWLGGRFGDAGVRRFGVPGLGYVAAVAALVSVPFGFGFGFASSTPVALACMCATVLFFGAWQGPGFGMAMGVANPRMRGSAASFIQLSCNLFGAGVGPFAMGVLSDAWNGDLRRALAVVLFANLGTALFFLLAARFAKAAAAAGEITGAPRAGVIAH